MRIAFARERPKRDDDNWEPHLVDHQMLHLKPTTSQYRSATTPGEFRCYIRCRFELLLLPFRWCWFACVMVEAIGCTAASENLNCRSCLLKRCHSDQRCCIRRVALPSGWRSYHTIDPYTYPNNRWRTNVQQLTCNIDSSNSFYYLFFFLFSSHWAKTLRLKGKVLGEKFWKSVKKCGKVWKLWNDFAL